MLIFNWSLKECCSLLLVLSCLNFTYGYNELSCADGESYFNPIPNSTSSTPETDSLALVALYEATNGANWARKWKLNSPVNTWYGVSLNHNGYVTHINLINNLLIGAIPSEIGNFSFLEELSLMQNQLGGNIPP